MSHRSGRSSIFHASKVSRLTSASQHSIIDVNELVRNVLRQTAEIEERHKQSERSGCNAVGGEASSGRARATSGPGASGARPNRGRNKAERERQQAEREADQQRIDTATEAERQRLQAIAATGRDRLQLETMHAEAAAIAERDRTVIEQRRVRLPS